MCILRHSSPIGLVLLSFFLHYSLSALCSFNYLFLLSVYTSLYFNSTVCIYFSFPLSKLFSFSLFLFFLMCTCNYVKTFTATCMHKNITNVFTNTDKTTIPNVCYKDCYSGHIRKNPISKMGIRHWLW